MLAINFMFARKNSKHQDEGLRFGNRYSEFRKRQKAMEKLEKRYARGEISYEEYEKRRKAYETEVSHDNMRLR
jgi:uncharacterized membrane protein